MSTDLDVQLAGDVAVAWHDVTCPEGPECRSRSLHAVSSTTASVYLPQFLKRLNQLRGGDPAEQVRRVRDALVYTRQELQKNNGFLYWSGLRFICDQFERALRGDL